MAARTLTPARALRRPRRLDLRVAIGLVLALAAVGGGLIASRDLPTGATLRADDLAVAQVNLDDALYATALPAIEFAAVVGRRLAG